jgi:fumarate reductase subunit D
VKALMLKLEPIIWALFGGGMMVGGLLLPGILLVLGLAGPLGWLPEGALAFERIHALVAHPLGRLVAVAVIALPLFAGAHHLRHVWMDFGGLRSDGIVGSLLYAIAAVGSALAIVAVVRL